MRNRSELVRRSCLLGAGLLIAAAATADGIGPLGEAIGATRPILDSRLRLEDVSQDPMADPAEALTLRARLGFETGKAWDTTLLVEGEFIWPLIDRYNSTINGNTAYPVVADPEDYEVNRLQLTNTSLSATTLTLGRQRIVLDDHRFVGNVGWRQNEQTFDSVRVVNKSVPNLTFDVAYVDQVNRVFGKDSPQGRYEGNTILANVAYQFAHDKVTGFGYRVDIDPIAAMPAAVRDSSITFGARLAGERPMSAVKLSYLASYATQREDGANPLSFDLDYYLAELTGSYRYSSLGAGVEVLEGDGVKGFTTPLATLHRFQGWADKFLTTPVDGIVDRYVNVGFTLQRLGPLEAVSALASHHWYEGERIAHDYGSELNVQVQGKWHRFTGAIKYADYRAKDFATDTSKFWVQVEYVW
jgi:hypothetical protein